MLSFLGLGQRYHIGELNFLSKAVQDERPGEELEFSITKGFSFRACLAVFLLFSLCFFSVVDLGGEVYKVLEILQ